MDSRQLQTFLWVVRLGGVGAAARHLNVTQPTVTRRIQELERELKAPLLEREGRNVVPTRAGRLCLANAERILAEIAALRLVASGQASVAGTLRVGVVELIALTWLDRLLRRIGEAYPNIRVDIDVDLSSRLVDRLARRRLDLVLVPGAIGVPAVVRTPLGGCPVRWMAHPDLLRIDDKLSPAHLADLPLIMLPQDADIHATMTAWFNSADIKPKRVSQCNSFAVIASLVRKGLGVGLLPPDLFASDLQSGALIALPEEPKLTIPEYSAAYIPSRERSFLPDIVAFAEEESQFTKF
jgi:DNA-binding transcriptional LysR family regulator